MLGAKRVSVGRGRTSSAAVIVALAALASAATASPAITEYPLPSPSSVPFGITMGSDGALWFTENQSDRIGRITTSGSVTEYQLPTDRQPFEITNGPDGALWFTDVANEQGLSDAIGCIK